MFEFLFWSFLIYCIFGFFYGVWDHARYEEERKRKESESNQSKSV